MKRLFLLFSYVIGSIFTLFSQIHEGYYDLAESKTGEELKTALYTIIKDHTEYPYTSSSTDVWDILKETDKDSNNADNVILFYTGWSVNAAQEYNDGLGWCREHIWAKSRGDFGTSLGAGTDTHHIRPVDISVNSARNNRWFDTCCIPYLDGDSITGCFTSSTRWVWQPREEVKGDVARMIFYMATRYEGENDEPDLEVIDSIPSNNDTNEPIHAKLSALLARHQEDPIDDFERNRNEVIYSLQNNRNPFIDHPEYVNEIWGTDTYISSKSISIPKEYINQLVVYPNPFYQSTIVKFPNPGHKVYRLILYDITGRIRKVMDNITEGSIVISRNGLPEGLYLIEIKGPKIFRGKVVIK